jgi:acyl-coenzyme A thioesterase PaaI-like protein
MLVSENVLKWALRFYPPLLFQRIWVIRFKKDFRGVSVKVNKSLVNNNYNNSIFGGTIFSAADPFYPLLFQQLLTHKGYKVRVWLKSAEIKYVKAGRTDLFFNIDITDADIEEVEQVLNTTGKYTKNFILEMYNKEGKLCVSVSSEIYIRNIALTETDNSVSI